MGGGGPPQARDVLEDQYEVGEVGTCRGLGEARVCMPHVGECAGGDAT